MLIKIDNSVIDFINANIANLNLFSKEVKAINSIAHAYINMQHLVIASRDVLDYLCEFSLLDNSSKMVFYYLSSQSYYFDEYEKKFECMIIAHKRQKEFSKVNNTYRVPLESLQQLSYSTLISENLSDCYFYESLCKKMMTENNEYNNFSIQFHHIHCGGSDAYKTTLNELNYNNFCLLIMDTDKSYKDDDVGTSLKSARKIYIEKKNDHIIDLYELGVREKENIIPPSYYLLCLNPPQKKLFYRLISYEEDENNNEYLRYLDLKDGIKAKKYKAKDTNWHKLYDPYLMELEINELLSCSIEQINNQDDEFLFLKGIGGDIVDTFRKDILCGGLKDKLEEKRIINGIPPNAIKALEIQVERSLSLFTNLPSYIRNDWIGLCNKLLAWGCCALESQAIINY